MTKNHFGENTDLPRGVTKLTDCFSWIREHDFASVDKSVLERNLARHEEFVKEERVRRGISELETSMGSRYTFSRMGLNRYKVYAKSQKEVFIQIKSIAANIAANIADGKGLVLFGSVGTGKDHLAASLLYTAVLAGFTATWYSCQSLFGESRDRIGKGQDEQSLVARLVTPDVLCLSDLIPARGELSSWNTNLLYRLIDARNRNLKPTWATINAANEEEIKRDLTVPVWDRLREAALVLPCFWESYRKMT